MGEKEETSVSFKYFMFFSREEEITGGIRKVVF